MTNANRFNPRNKALGQANTLLILSTLKTGPKTVTELMAISGLTRQTVFAKIKANSDVIKVQDSWPKKYYIGEAEELATIATENTTQRVTKLSVPKAAIVADTSVVFFPNATHNDHSKFHDTIINSDTNIGLLQSYKDIKDTNDLDRLEHMVKTMYDLIQFRKTLKEFG